MATTGFSMSHPLPSLVDRTKRWIKLLKRERRSSTIRSDERTGAEIFSNAQDFDVNGGNFINEVNGGSIINEVNVGNIINGMKINYINDVVSSKQAVFELLEPYTCLDATKDSSARYPPPRCHHGTRLKIRERLTRWLFVEYDQWKMMWVRGSAGTGKSAVAQSFGDACGEEEKHGASYFFSRTAGRNKLETVVPTIVCQLATTIPEYRSLIGHQLANNPFLLRQSPPVQFRELIVKPFMSLQRQHPRKPIVIILDGLDECEGEDAQRRIIEMVTNAVRSNPDLPLRWLILSRLEAHLKNAFSRNLLCGREELIIDAECRDDVERYVKDRFLEIQNAYNDVTPADWPSPENLQELLDAVSGLFVFASTCLNSIADPDEADPPSQLNSLLTFMRRSQGVVSRNPLAVLDLLYSRILEKIPADVYATTRRILAYMSHRNEIDQDSALESAQTLSNFLQIDRHDFYKAARGLHSVASIPDPEDADKSQIQFYHASFQDFLVDPNRSGKFCISEQDALADIVPLCVYQCELDATQFHAADELDYDYGHEQCRVPDLTWASEDNQLWLSQSITLFWSHVLNYFFRLQFDCVEETFVSRFSSLDFRYWGPAHIVCAARVCLLDLSTSIVRVEPSSQTDHQLQEYMDLVIGHGIAKPARLPLRHDLPADEWTREYFFIGHGIKSVIVWRTKSPASGLQIPYSLRSDQEPSEALISKYDKYLQEIEWDEDKAMAEMK